ncbi:MAG TPA: hypothetical protein VEA15_02245 [Caulobacteraceae bacterium]|nr:hypothetical protein [Caulobacteraceae bacterium]
MSAILAALVAAKLGGAAAEPPKTKEDKPVTHTVTAEGVAGLPFSHGKVFRTLDEYLEHRRALGAQDAPHYTEISPGVYELWGGRRPPGVKPPTFTRQQLLEEFGFRE